MQSNRTYSIYGRGGDSTATILPSLNAIANRGDVVQISKNTNAFKTWQNLILQDDIIENYTRYEYPYSVVTNPRAATISWDFSLPGMVEMSQIALEFNMTIAAVCPNLQSFAEMPQAQYCMARIFDRLRVQVGNNSYVIGKEELITTIGLKAQLIVKKKTPTQRANLAQWGECYSIASRDTRGYYFNALDPYANFFVNSLGSWVNSERTKQMSIMLADLIPFFDQPGTCLPKGLPIKIQLELEVPTTLVAGTGSPDRIEIRAPTPTGLLPVIVYNYFILQEDTQKIFNSKWVAQSLLYNYLKWDIFTENCTDRGFEYNTMIKINQQRPQDLIIMPMLVGETLQQLVPGKWAYPWSAIAPIKLQFLRFYIQGRLIYELKSTGPANAYMSSAPAFTNINNLINEQNAREDQMNVLEDFNFGVNLNSGNYWKIPFTPGFFFKRGITSMDQGAINLNVNIGLNIQQTTPEDAPIMSKDIKIVYFTRNPAQISIDSNFNVLEVEWPAIISDSIFLQKTINTN